MTKRQRVTPAEVDDWLTAAQRREARGEPLEPLDGHLVAEVRYRGADPTRPRPRPRLAPRQSGIGPEFIVSHFWDDLTRTLVLIQKQSAKGRDRRRAKRLIKELEWFHGAALQLHAERSTHVGLNGDGFSRILEKARSEIGR